MAKKIDKKELLIGAHTSIAGGVHNALLHGQTIGATTIQIFTANQRQWAAKPISEEEIQLFKETQCATKIKAVMSHASYLLNLGSPDPQMLQKSRKAFEEEIERSMSLGLTFVNFHPGAALQESREACLERIVESLLLMEAHFVDDDLRLLLETTAGQGSGVGCSFEELGYILKRVGKKIPLGVCIDTCHIFSAGYDIRTAQAWDATLACFDREVGLHNLYAIHVNDSMKELGARLDRHASLGEGKIGLESFKYLMTHPILREIPKYLETPEGMERWDKEIWMLREYAD